MGCDEVSCCVGVKVSYAFALYEALLLVLSLWVYVTALIQGLDMIVVFLMLWEKFLLWR